MLNAFSKDNFHALCDQVASSDEQLDMIVKQYGYPPFWSRPNTYESLVHIILEQQVSLASALASLKKLQEKTGNLTPAALLTLTDEELRACYVSRQKIIYLRGLAEALEQGDLNLERLATEPDESIREQLIRLKGIGHWTVDVYLIFVLHRADVFPIGDLGVVNAIKRVKSLPKDAPRELMLELAEGWRPYRTIATMLLWHYYLSTLPKNLRKTTGENPA